MPNKLPDITTSLSKLIQVIGSKTTYGGGQVSQSIMKKIIIETRVDGAGILAPYWLAVLQKGRGPRKTTKDHQLAKKIFFWMKKRGMFKTRTKKGQENEARQLTWYINHFGNKQFNKGNPIYIDIYENARKECIKEVNKQYGDYVFQISKSIL